MTRKGANGAGTRSDAPPDAVAALHARTEGKYSLGKNLQRLLSSTFKTETRHNQKQNQNITKPKLKPEREEPENYSLQSERLQR